ncbi:MAG: replication initiation protein [Treponema sp.]|jgi:hypothetical protein|nr:replication initiation protein [Treponema sp.]
MKSIAQPDLFEQAPANRPAILDQFYEYLPPRPYCTDALAFGLKIRPKAQAIKDAYIQPNPITRAYWMIFDIDNDDRRFWPDERGVPCPNMEALNRDNGHRHLYYQIDPAVYTLRQARRKPMELAADVDKGLTRLLGADPSYGKLIAKNPYSSKWELWVWHERAWGLTELLAFIPAKVQAWKPAPRDTIGLGRNCAVFDQARGYAYAEWRRLRYQDAGRLLAAVYEYSMNINAAFHTPMIDREVHCIARSITRWTSRHMTAEGMSAWGESGRCKSITTRQAKAAGRAEEIRAFYDSRPDVTREQLALIFDMSPSTIKGLDLPLTETRKEARRGKAAQRAEEIRAYKAAHPHMSNRDIGKALGVSRQTVDKAVKNGY